MQISPHLVYLMPPNRAPFAYNRGGMGSVLSRKRCGTNKFPRIMILQPARYENDQYVNISAAARSDIWPKADFPSHSHRGCSYVIIAVAPENF